MFFFVGFLVITIMAGWTMELRMPKQKVAFKVLQQLLTIMAILGTVTFIVTLGLFLSKTPQWGAVGNRYR